VPERADGDRLVDQAKRHLAAIPVSAIGECIRRGGLLLDGQVAAIAAPIASGQVVTLTASAWSDFLVAGRVTPVSDRPIRVLLEDDDLIIVDKPAGVHVHPMGQHRDDTLLGALLRLAGATTDSPWARWRPHPVHRLDRPVSGVIAWAKNRAARDVLQKHLEARRINRLYLARVNGSVAQDRGAIDIPLGVDPADDRRRTRVEISEGGQQAVTHWQVTSREQAWSTVELRLETGRTHQIRAHLELLGHPILRDTLYGALDGPPRLRGVPDAGLPQIALHATRLTFPHPATGEPVTVTSQPPWD
jgi:23S rRNA pseudouridine1911/1915/1917 synthase